MYSLLFRYVDPMSGSSHHSLSIDGPESKMVAELETSSICCQVIDSQFVRIGSVGYQILHISPRQLRTAFVKHKQ